VEEVKAMGEYDLKPLTVTEAGAIHRELGRLAESVERQNDLAVEARNEAKETRKLMREELQAAREERRAEIAALPCVAHAASIAVTTERVDRLNNGRTTKPATGPGMHAVTEGDLAARLENTERTVIARTGEQVEATIAAKLQAGVEAVLDKRAAEAERVAAERREQTKRDLAAQQAKVAADLAAAAAAKAESDKVRWKRVEWIVGLAATFLSSSVVLSYCNTKNQMAEDRQATSTQMAKDREAVVQQLKSIPGEVVKKVEPALAPAAPKEVK
jgi:hypothetical protein